MRHSHATTLDKAAAAEAQRTASVIGWVEGEPVTRDRLDQRLAALRAGPRAAALPQVGTSEDRQLVRWTATVLFTEEVCRREAARLGVRGVPRALSAIEAVQFGSINTAAWQGCAEVAAVFDAVVPPRSLPGQTSVRRWWRLSYGDDLVPMGWTTLDDVPAALASAVRAAEVGDRVGPVLAGGRTHVARVDEIEDRVSDVEVSDTGERVREFSRWLDRRRGEAVRVAPGFEHPGDPAQPDNTHRH
ncbi:DUF7158 domain-containing protein [Actinokineospora sp. HUAS TT18]|uniref:DUF7158 domain-containing protein n=1 Tax=Actinokineospora sp. HUAS TT18 TaxID=3447451 RepID=UPI003F51CDCE